MCSVAVRIIGGELAAAEGHDFRLIDNNFNWRELGSFVSPIAERLFIGVAAAAPIIGAGVHFLNERPGLSNFWF